jgi:2-polyprenyl-6-methoxyphenol hydroxylase-like FAD-dependent oxidoreductase
MYDVIVVGARVAGAATAMLLARGGLRVLAVDRAAFPSDTLSTHQVQLPGAALLRRWGLLESILAAGTPVARHVRFDPGPAVVEGRFDAFDGVDGVISPRRTHLDALLVDAARSAGAEVRERFAVEELLWEDGRVAGVRGRSLGAPAGTPRVSERAALVVGADGRNSLVANAVRAAEYRVQEPLTFGYYTYWAGVPLAGGELYGRDRRLLGAWPTDDGLVMTYVSGPVDDFKAFRGDVEASMLAVLDVAGDLGERVRAGTRAERFAGSAGTRNAFRVPHGPGWALVGDAGLLMDPITGQGITNAFRDAQLLSEAVGDASGRGPAALDGALAGFRERRDSAVSPMYDLTLQLAAITPPGLPERALFSALAAKPQAAARFLGVLTGTVHPDAVFSPRALARTIGLRGLARAVGRRPLRAPYEPAMAR